MKAGGGEINRCGEAYDSNAKNGICLRSENAADALVVDLTIGRGLARRADRTRRLDHTVRQPRRIGRIV